ncbi:MAG: TIGR01212 family radical SAM protein [Lachnospiraceae bacterium]|nr:TIGR01212 family radical SAM protein [Lachnospiraceae bacterium]
MRWDEKPYHSLDYEMKQRFGEKVYRLALNGGMTCPNRDGTIGRGGCIFCSGGGSGEFAAHASLSVTRQIEVQKQMIRRKRPVQKFIAYFQAYTNTYAPVDYLEQIFTEAIADPEVAVLSIATRPDCLPPEVLLLLQRLNSIKPVWVELGLQTIHEDTASLIRRGYPLSCFKEAVQNLRDSGIEVIVHTILGLPGESEERILETIDYLNRCDIQGIKLQLLHILKGTDLADYYERTHFPVMSMEDYIDLLIDCIERLSPDIVIHRLTGDGPGDLLIAPQWSRNKRTVLNQIHAAFRSRGTWQGKYYIKEDSHAGTIYTV